MKTKTSLKLALGATFATGIALGAAQALADNPFSAKTLDSGYMQLAENKAGGEMKCGAGMCGGNMKKGAAANAADGDTCPADTDKDGKVTKEEFLKHHEAMFDEADANKDGSLDATERKAMHSKMGEGKCGTAKVDDAAARPAVEAKPAAAPAATPEKK
jgi:uncharacterized low-complexity protein